jgi:hypothetical protein
MNLALKTLDKGLYPCSAVAWLLALMPDDNDSNTGFEAPIYDRIWKDSKRKHAATLCGGCTNAWVFD